MKSKQFHSKLFTDPYILTLSPVEKLIFMYYVFNSKVNWIGTYEIADKSVIFELGVTQEELDYVKNKFQTEEKVLFIDHWVILKNSEKYDSFLNNVQLMNSALLQYDALPIKVKTAFGIFKPEPILAKYKSMSQTCKTRRLNTPPKKRAKNKQK